MGGLGVSLAARSLSGSPVGSKSALFSDFGRHFGIQSGDFGTSGNHCGDFGDHFGDFGGLLIALGIHFESFWVPF